MDTDYRTRDDTLLLNGIECQALLSAPLAPMVTPLDLDPPKSSLSRYSVSHCSSSFDHPTPDSVIDEDARLAITLFRLLTNSYGPPSFLRTSLHLEQLPLPSPSARPARHTSRDSWDSRAISFMLDQTDVPVGSRERKDHNLTASSRRAERPSESTLPWIAVHPITRYQVSLL